MQTGCIHLLLDYMRSTSLASRFDYCGCIQTWVTTIGDIIARHVDKVIYVSTSSEQFPSASFSKFN